MNKEALKHEIHLVLTDPDTNLSHGARRALEYVFGQLEALAQPEQEPVGKLQEDTAERAWFTIAELNAWADKKLSENPHWVMPKDEPERDELPPQRKPLTDEQVKEITLQIGWTQLSADDLKFCRAIEAKLKEKNT